jgi:hypothetical protein
MKPIDSDTGEVLIPQTVYRRADEVVVAFNPKQSNRNIKHVRVRTARKQNRVYDKLTLNECGFLFKVLPYLEWESNILAGDGEIAPKGKPLNYTQIDAIVGISKHLRIDIVKSLTEKKVFGFMMIRGKRVALVLNPEYVLRGRKPDGALKQAFDYEEDLDEQE